MTITKAPTVPLYVLCGPLGSGKTTLLMRLLQYWREQGKRVAVLMNEAGEVSLDGPRAAMKAVAVYDITGGCVCCNARPDILAGLRELAEWHRAEVVILECSGLAHVEEIINAVTDPLCQALVHLAKVIALVQPATGQKSRSIGTRFAEVIRYADDIVLNKRDLVPPEDWERFRRALVRDNRAARLWQTAHAAVDVKAMLDFQGRVPIPTGTRVSFGAPGGHPLVVTLRLPCPMHRGRFTRWFGALPEGLERVKGLCRFSDSEALHEVQYASPVTRWVGTIQLPVEPEHVMVLIGQHYDLGQCRAELHACLSGA